MANPHPSRVSVSGLQETPSRRGGGGLRRAVLLGFVVAGLLALAWFDGGEEPLHPIADPVVLPVQEQGM